MKVVDWSLLVSTSIFFQNFRVICSAFCHTFSLFLFPIFPFVSFLFLVYLSLFHFSFSISSSSGNKVATNCASSLPVDTDVGSPQESWKTPEGACVPATVLRSEVEDQTVGTMSQSKQMTLTSVGSTPCFLIFSMRSCMFNAV